MELANSNASSCCTSYTGSSAKLYIFLKLVALNSFVLKFLLLLGYTVLNAFTVLMNSARQLASRILPPVIDEPKTGKQKLWNAVVSFLSERGHVWRTWHVRMMIVVCL